MSAGNWSLLWEVRAPEAPFASYLFGTMHVRDRRAFRQEALILQKIDACTAFACEYDLDLADSDLPGKPFHLPDGRVLNDYLPARKYGRTRMALLKATGIDIGHYRRLRPSIILQLLGEQVLAADRPLALDAYLWHYAREAGKELVGIETFAEQLELLQSLPVEPQVRSLAAVARNFASFRRQLMHLAACYEKGDLQRLYQLSRRQAGGARKSLLLERNRIMAERLDPLLRNHSLFAALGAAHLGGQKGVLRLLKLKGWKVKRVEGWKGDRG